MIGSCFTTYIAEKLVSGKFKILCNPFGTLYHPFAVNHNLSNAINGIPPDESMICRLENRYVHFACHSKIHGTSPEDLRVALIRVQEEVSNFIREVKYIFITLGTSFYFIHKQLDCIVGNCHKQPANHFDRRIANADQLITCLEELISAINRVNAYAKVVFTVSPVRHIRDGLVNNNRSKAHLMTAIHSVIDRFEHTSYFPSFEILMDDLRDYRFYDTDLIHPSNQAVDYVWNKFIDVYFNNETLELLKKIKNVQNGLNHRPFDPSSPSYKRHLERIRTTIRELSRHESIDLSTELELLQTRSQECKNAFKGS